MSAATCGSSPGYRFAHPGYGLLIIFPKEQDMNDDADTSAPDRAGRAVAKSNIPVAKGNIRAPKLTREQKIYVVRRLAAYDGPAEIARDLRREFGVEISRQAIGQYDPSKGAEIAEEWGDLFRNARREYMGDKADLAGKSRRVERIVLRAVEILADRILKGVDAEGRRMFTKRPEDITDEDRIAALQVFLENLKETNPPGYATIQAALSDAHRPHATDAAAPGTRQAPGEAPHAG
jgi:hypothetical protein